MITKILGLLMNNSSSQKALWKHWLINMTQKTQTKICSLSLNFEHFGKQRIIKREIIFVLCVVVLQLFTTVCVRMRTTYILRWEAYFIIIVTLLYLGRMVKLITWDTLNKNTSKYQLRYRQHFFWRYRERRLSISTGRHRTRRELLKSKLISWNCGHLGVSDCQF